MPIHDPLSASSFYQELKSWQTGIGALIGFVALATAALYNFHLHRKRDREARHAEMISVANAIYGEILLLREQLAGLARISAHFHINRNDDFSEFRADVYRPDQPAVYPALLNKIGLLDAELVRGITKFYGNVADANRGLTSILAEHNGPRFTTTIVLRPAVAAIHEVVPHLRTIESLTGAPEAPAKLDVGLAPDIVEWEDELVEIHENG